MQKQTTPFVGSTHEVGQHLFTDRAEVALMGDEGGLFDTGSSALPFTPTPGTISSSVSEVRPLWVARGILSTNCRSLAPVTAQSARRSETADTHSF